MGLLQKAVETYDANETLAGIYRENGSEPLAPIGHSLTDANVEITLDQTGRFLSARNVDKSEPKILFPVTEESNGRTSKSAIEHPHPLCDKIKYYTATENRYIPQLKAWSESRHSHPFLKTILSYVEKGCIISDLTESGIIKSGSKTDDLFVCWRINGFDGEEPACWKNQKLFRAFTDYYCELISTRGSSLCMISGETAPTAVQHPKGIISINGNAKLISSNDSDGFTYRGRFEDDWQAATIGYVASQKAHNAIRWLASSQEVREISGNRVFLCWNPRGVKPPRPMLRFRKDSEPKRQPSDYKQALQSTLLSYRKDKRLKGTETAVLASFDAATTGRLSLTYYNEISLDLFLERMERWDENCCWYWYNSNSNNDYWIQSPSLLQIAECACVVRRSNSLEADDKESDKDKDKDRVMRQYLQRLLVCKVGGGVFPVDILKALTQRASTPQSFVKNWRESGENIWRKILFTACSVLQKYRYDTKQGGNEMAWELDRKDRSFQFGRLLAVMERGETDYYDKTQEKRQTNAIKFMSEYRQRPWSVFERVNRQLHQAYLNRIDPRQAERYERLVGEIVGLLSGFREEDLNKPLEDVYLMGYELQRNAFFTKKETNNEDENKEEE